MSMYLKVLIGLGVIGIIFVVARFVWTSVRLYKEIKPLDWDLEDRGDFLPRGG